MTGTLVVKGSKDSGSYVLKLNKDDEQKIATMNGNKGMFQPNADVVDLVLQNYFNDIKRSQDAFAQQENEVIHQINKLFRIT